MYVMHQLSKVMKYSPLATSQIFTTSYLSIWFRIGFMYAYRYGVSCPNWATAFKIWRKEYYEHCTAQSWIGFCYYSGYGVAQDYRKLWSGTKKLPIKEMPMLKIISDLVMTMVTQDYKKAVEWYEKAANQGNTVCSIQSRKLLSIWSKNYEESCGS